MSVRNRGFRLGRPSAAAAALGFPCVVKVRASRQGVGVVLCERRDQLDYDIAWTTEFGEFVMVWTTFLGAAAAARRRGHMAITELVELLGQGTGGRLLRLAIDCIVAAVLGVLVWYGTVIVQASWGNILTVLDWPMAWQYMALPVGSAIALVYVLRDLVVLARGGTLEPSPESVS